MTDYVATRWYRPPELLLCSDDYGKEVDIWAIASIMGEITDGQPLFPGESDIDQLYVIQNVLGPITKDQTEAFSRNPAFVGLKIPAIGTPETLDLKYFGKMSRQALSFMKGCLAMDPANRLTAEQAVAHPYFDDIREAP